MAKPIVDGIEKDLKGRAQVVRLGVTNSPGIDAAMRYGVRGVPTVIIFDGAGHAVEQSVGIPDRARVVAQVEQLLD